MKQATQSKLTKIVFFIFGVAALLTVLLAYHVFAAATARQTKLSCHNLKPTVTKTEYCVYHKTTPGFLVSTNTLLVGPSASRGVEYSIPYGEQDVKVEWNEGTDVVVITMPGTQLTINPETYVDTR